MKKRIFIFASYDQDCIIDKLVLHYLKSLSKLGDIIFFADSNHPEKELGKVRRIPNVIFANAERHGEYDFGSYKRGLIWAEQQGIPKNYEWLYFLNDSVAGPFLPLEPVFDDLEEADTDFTGLLGNFN